MAVVCWLPLLLALPAGAAAPPVTRTATARALVAALVKEDFAAARRHFNPTLAKALPEEKLRELWRLVLKQLGPVRRVGDPRPAAGGFVEVPCRFEKMALDLRVAFDHDGRVGGFTFQLARATSFALPPYVRRESFREVEVVVGAGGDWPLPGTLTLPKGAGPFPAVVLVHGSGAHDRDETIGPNKPFRDLAWGLASRGVAVLRYEKRNYKHAARLKASTETLTIREEVTDDALAAVALLRRRKEVNGRRIFVLGHSLGGMVAPQIGAGDSKLAGLILLAGNSRPLEDLIVEQFTYLFSLEGKISAENRKELEKIEKQVARVKDRKLAPDTPAKELPLGIPARYWLALRAYDQKATAARLRLPLLVLQGERDYQVSMADFAGWQKALAGRRDVRCKSYPALNHLFMVGKGKARPKEYGQAGHVAQEVIDDVAAWIKGR
jgi:dienelactone hydrolase